MTPNDFYQLKAMKIEKDFSYLIHYLNKIDSKTQDNFFDNLNLINDAYDKITKQDKLELRFYLDAKYVYANPELSETGVIAGLFFKGEPFALSVYSGYYGEVNEIYITNKQVLEHVKRFLSSFKDTQDFYLTSPTEDIADIEIVGCYNFLDYYNLENRMVYNKGDEVLAFIPLEVDRKLGAHSAEKYKEFVLTNVKIEFVRPLLKVNTYLVYIPTPHVYLNDVDEAKKIASKGAAKHIYIDNRYILGKKEDFSPTIAVTDFVLGGMNEDLVVIQDTDLEKIKMKLTLEKKLGNSLEKKTNFKV